MLINFADEIKISKSNKEMLNFPKKELNIGIKTGKFSRKRLG